MRYRDRATFLVFFRRRGINPKEYRGRGIFSFSDLLGRKSLLNKEISKKIQNPGATPPQALLALELSEESAAMSDFCQPLKKQDPEAFALCQRLVQDGETLKTLDRGVTRLDYSKEKPKRITIGKGDGKVSAQEVYDRFLDKVEEEELRRAKEYSANLKRPPSFQSTYLEWMKSAGKTEVPWIFEDLDPSTKGDKKLFRRTLKKIKLIQKELKSEGLKEGSPEYIKKLAIRIFEYIQTSSADGGLGIQYSDNGSRPGRDLGRIYSTGEATCLEFVRLYFALGRIAGLDVVPIEVFRNANGKILEHVRVGVRYDQKNPEKIFFLDIAEGLVGERKGEVWTQLSRLDLLAYYYNTKATTVSTKEMGSSYQKALRYSPYQYMILTNYGMWLLTNGKIKKAQKIFEKACRANCSYPFIFVGLEKVFQKQGKAEKAKWAAEQAEKLFKARKVVE